MKLVSDVVGCYSREFVDPRLLGTDHFIEGDQDFAHAGDERDFLDLGGRVSGPFDQPQVKGLDDGTPSNGGERGHVQDSADFTASSPDAAFAFELSAVVVVTGQADQRGDALAVELSQFREVGNERAAANIRQAGMRLNDLVAAFPVVVLVDQLGDLRFEVADLSLQEFEDVSHADQRLLGRELLLAIGLGRAEVNELPAAFHQMFVLGLRPGGPLGRTKLVAPAIR